MNSIFLFNTASCAYSQYCSSSEMMHSFLFYILRNVWRSNYCRIWYSNTHRNISQHVAYSWSTEAVCFASSWHCTVFEIEITLVYIYIYIYISCTRKLARLLWNIRMRDLFVDRRIDHICVLPKLSCEEISLDGSMHKKKIGVHTWCCEIKTKMCQSEVWFAIMLHQCSAYNVIYRTYAWHFCFQNLRNDQLYLVL